MAARLNPKHDERTRDKIRTSQLINRLQDFSFGKFEMSNGQVKAALGLLAKTLPDLAKTELTGPEGGPLAVKFTTVYDT